MMYSHLRRHTNIVKRHLVVFISHPVIISSKSATKVKFFLTTYWIHF